MTFSVFSDYKYGVETSALHNLREFFYLHFASMEKTVFWTLFSKIDNYVTGHFGLTVKKSPLEIFPRDLSGTLSIKIDQNLNF